MVEFASFGRRLWGFVLDVFVDLLVLGVLGSVVGDGASVAGPMLVWLLIHHVALVAEGGTIGHRAAGIRIVAEDGANLGFAHAFVRVIIKYLISLPPIALGYMWMLDDPSRQTWHDRIASSVVVRDVRAGRTLAPAWADAPPWRGDDVRPSASATAPAAAHAPATDPVTGVGPAAPSSLPEPPRSDGDSHV